MNKSSFFAFLAVFLLVLLGIKGFHLLQHRPWHADGHFRYLSAAVDTSENENGYFRRHERAVHRRGGAPEVDLAIRRQLDAAAEAVTPPASPVGYAEPPEAGESLSAGRRIAGIYARMAPEDAARIIGTMDTGRIVRLLKLMRPEDASAVLARLPLEKAREATERMLEQSAL